MLSAGRVYQPVSHVRMYYSSNNMSSTDTEIHSKEVPAPRWTRESEWIRPMQPNPSYLQAQPCSDEPAFDNVNGEGSSMGLQRTLPIASNSPTGSVDWLPFHATETATFREPDHVAQLPNPTGFPTFCCGFAMGYGTQASRAGPSPHVIRMQASIEVSPKRNRR